MHKTRNNFNYELLDGAILVGKYGIPQLKAINIIPEHLVPFDKALQEKEPNNKFVHFFINDFQFDRIWNKPNKYIKVLKRFAGVLAPDFSMFKNMPNATNIYAHYKKQTLSHFYSYNGIKVIPTFGACGEDSFNWCFDGMPNNSIIAVSTVGVNKEMFINAFKEMVKRLQPTYILVYGNIFEEMELPGIKEKLIKYETRIDYLRKIKKRSKILNGNK